MYELYQCSAWNPLTGEVLVASKPITSKTQQGARDDFIHSLELPDDVKVSDLSISVLTLPLH